MLNQSHLGPSSVRVVLRRIRRWHWVFQKQLCEGAALSVLGIGGLSQHMAPLALACIPLTLEIGPSTQHPLFHWLARTLAPWAAFSRPHPDVNKIN